MILGLYECAKTSRTSDCDSGGRHAGSTGGPLALWLQQLLCPPLHHHPHPPITTTTTTTRSQGDVTAASLCCQPARHVTWGRQSDRVTISHPAPGCENHNIVHAVCHCVYTPPLPPFRIFCSIKTQWCVISRCFWLVQGLSISSSHQWRS